jgi:hypothetical protein
MTETKTLNLTNFCKTYSLSYEIVRPLINKAIQEHRDDCVLFIGKQRIKILDDKKFIEFINDQKRRELERCQAMEKIKMKKTHTCGEIYTGSTIPKMDYSCIGQLKQIINY